MKVCLLLLVIVLLVILLVRLTPPFFRTIRASYLVSVGRYAQSRGYLQRAVVRRASWLGFTPELRRKCRFDLAVCHFEEGKLEEAAATLLADQTHGLFGDAADAMVAAALLLADKNPSTARRHLERIVNRRGSSNVVLLLSHALLSDGDEEAARAMFATADDATTLTSGSVRWGALVRFDSRIRAPFAEAFLRGWFYLRTGEPDRAQPLLAQAAECPFPNHFSRTAAEYFKRTFPGAARVVRKTALVPVRGLLVGPDTQIAPRCWDSLKTWIYESSRSTQSWRPQTFLGRSRRRSSSSRWTP